MSHAPGSAPVSLRGADKLARIINGNTLRTALAASSARSA